MGARQVAAQELRTVLAQIAADWQTAKGYELVIETNNRDDIDPATQHTPFLQVTFAPLTGHQMDLGADPFSQQEGVLLISAVVRCGDGTVEAEELLDFVSPYFHLKNLSTLRFRAFVNVKGKKVNEWWHECAIVEWWYYWK